MGWKEIKSTKEIFPPRTDDSTIKMFALIQTPLIPSKSRIQAKLVKRDLTENTGVRSAFSFQQFSLPNKCTCKSLLYFVFCNPRLCSFLASLRKSQGDHCGYLPHPPWFPQTMDTDHLCLYGIDLFKVLDSLEKCFCGAVFTSWLKILHLRILYKKPFWYIFFLIFLNYLSNCGVERNIAQVDHRSKFLHRLLIYQEIKTLLFLQWRLTMFVSITTLA